MIQAFIGLGLAIGALYVEDPKIWIPMVGASLVFGIWGLLSD